MPNSAWIDATGSGTVDFNSNQPIRPLVLVAQLVALTNPKVRQVGETFPKRLMYAGLVGFTTQDALLDGTLTQAIGPWHRVEWEFEEWQCQVETVAPFESTFLFWRLPINIEFQLQVFW